MYKHRKWNKTQSGFTKQRSTMEHIYRLSNAIDKGFQKDACTLAVMLDVEKAFDRLWFDGMKFKLLAYGINKSMIRWLSGFLTGRQSQVTINGTYSNPFTPMAGVPQGSVLGPILFNMYVNDIPAGNHFNSSHSQYADDVSYWATSYSTKIANRILRRNLYRMEAWCSLNRIKINPKKTQAILFTRKYNRHRKRDINLTYNGQKIEVCKTVKLLGITFDKKTKLESSHRRRNETRTRSPQRTKGVRKQKMGSRYSTTPHVIQRKYKTNTRIWIPCTCRSAYHQS